MTIKANGKLLLSGEYFILNGALSLALPLKLGQSLTVKTSSGSEIAWKSYDHQKKLWFEAKFDLFDLSIEKTTDDESAEWLRKVLKAASRLNSDFLSTWKKYRVETHLEFDPNWGFGSSSSLIYCVSEWADVNPYELFFMTENGSGYDIACAYSEGPLLFQRTSTSLEVEEIDFNPSFQDNLYFVYLNMKQRSRPIVEKFKRKISEDKETTKELSKITETILKTKSLKVFEDQISKHEALIGEALDLPLAKDIFFDDYWGSIKSLGAWGGDFVLATSSKSKEETCNYFKQKGYDTIFPYSEIVL